MDREKMKGGILPGIIAGYVFLAYVGAGAVNPVLGEEGAIAMSMGSGMIADIGAMIGADAFIGFILHIIISGVIGALYTGVFLPRVDLGDRLMNIAVGGLIFGLIWWIVGGNIIMPAIANADLLQISFGPIFFGHIIFGHVLAFLVIGSSGDDDDGE